MLSVCYILAEQELEDSPDKRLNEQVLRKERKRQIKAYELEPMAKQSRNTKALEKREVNNCRDKAHCRTHDRNRNRDDCSLKDNGIVFFIIGGNVLFDY